MEKLSMNFDPDLMARLREDGKKNHRNLTQTVHMIVEKYYREESDGCGS